MPLSEIGESITYGEAWELVAELRNEYGTHTHASFEGWHFPATWGELLIAELAEWTANAYRDREKAQQPISYPRPWPDAEAATPEEKSEALAALERERERLLPHLD